jgi:hypothetical protein
MIDEKNYGDTIILNTRNVSDLQLCPDEEQTLSKSHIEKEFCIGEISKVEQDLVVDRCNMLLEERKKKLLAKPC